MSAHSDVNDAFLSGLVFGFDVGTGSIGYERMLEQDLDILDGLVSAEIQGEVAKHYDGPQADQKQLKLEETGGIPTGVAPDIHRQVELRKAKRAAVKCIND
jgi:hypothetical protein